jgi:hypothetical protein
MEFLFAAPLNAGRYSCADRDLSLKTEVYF